MVISLKHQRLIFIYIWVISILEIYLIITDIDNWWLAPAIVLISAALAAMSYWSQKIFGIEQEKSR
jgi:hypothetical protein